MEEVQDAGSSDHPDLHLLGGGTDCQYIFHSHFENHMLRW